MSETPPIYSNYPRQGQVPQADLRPPGVYFDTLGGGWELVKRDLAAWVLGTIIVFVLGYGAMMLVLLPVQLYLIGQFGEAGASTNPTAILLSSAAGLLPTALFLTLFAGMLTMGIRALNGEEVRAGMVFGGFRRFGTMLGISLVYTVLSALVQIAFVNLIGQVAVLVILVLILAVLAILTYPIYMFLPVHALVTGEPALPAVGEIYRRTYRFAFLFFVLNVGLGALLMLGMCAAFVGLLFAFPVYAAVIAMHYRYFFPPKTDATPTVIGSAAPR